MKGLGVGELHISNQPFRNTHFVIEIFGYLDINIEDFRSSPLGPTRARSFFMSTPESKSQVLQKLRRSKLQKDLSGARSELRSKILNIYIQASENLYYKVRIARWLIADV
jgi:hypothetical protein